MAPEGGLLPKSLYIKEEDTEGAEDHDSGHVLESLYTKAHVYKGLPHEVTPLVHILHIPFFRAAVAGHSILTGHLCLGGGGGGRQPLRPSDAHPPCPCMSWQFRSLWGNVGTGFTFCGSFSD